MSNFAEIKNLTENLDYDIIQAYWFDGGITIRLMSLEETKEAHIPAFSMSRLQFLELCSFLWEKLVKKGARA
jgi:hypothetical protein